MFLKKKRKPQMEHLDYNKFSPVLNCWKGIAEELHEHMGTWTTRLVHDENGFPLAHVNFMSNMQRSHYSYLKRYLMEIDWSDTSGWREIEEHLKKHGETIIGVYDKEGPSLFINKDEIVPNPRI